MKLTIVKTLAPDVRYPDADTGRLDTDNRQASEPVRLLPAGTEQKAVDENDLKYIRTVLAYDPSSKLKYLPRLIGTTDEAATRAMIDRGDAYILSYYTEQTRAKRQAAWEQKERERQASLMFWVFRNKVIKVEGWETANREEVVARVKHKVLSEDKVFQKMKSEIELFEKLEKMPPKHRRESIPDDVRVFVWRRDEGRCVRCGSQEKIELDHIIPLAKGGSNTARNVQVLCERCNREKGTTV